MTSPRSEPNHRILVIDDNASIHADFRKILASPGPRHTAMDEAEAALFDEAPTEHEQVIFEVDSASQGQEGLEMVRAAVAQRHPYALAFVDVRMPPGWDGIETISQIWRQYPEIQIVICTAYSDYSWAKIVQKLGRTDSLVILKKPFDNVEVLQLAHALTEKWFLARQARYRLEDLDRMVARRTRELQAANENLQKEIAQKVLVEGALRLSEERFSKAFQASPIALAIHTLDEGLFVDVNESFLKMTGFQCQEVLSRSYEQLRLYPDPALPQRLAGLLQETKSVRNEGCKLLTKSGASRDVLLSLEMFDLGVEPHVLLIAQDITDQLSLENRLRHAQKMEAVGQLAAGVAHDFNNILTVIQGHTSLMLAQASLGRQMADSLRQVSTAAERAATLTRQLLAFSRKQVMQSRALDVNDLLAHLTRMLQRLIGEHITLHCEFSEQPLPVFADAGCLEQVIINLAVNARDAMPAGGPLHIHTSLVVRDEGAAQRNPEARPGRFACVTVRDQGTGMTPDVLGRIFEPFYTTKDVGKGTGLGLATVYGILKQHEGWIEVESAPGQGTTFTFYVPLTGRRIALASTSPPPAAPVVPKETILVVEDEAALSDMIKSSLGQLGYQVWTAASGAEAVQLWGPRATDIHLLLTDMIMPGGISGREVAQQFRLGNPQIKVIYTSGYALELRESDELARNSAAFLAKPYDLARLTQVIRERLDHSHPAPHAAQAGEALVAAVQI